MKNLKKVIYVLILPLVVAGGLVFANDEIKKDKKPSPKPLTTAEKKARLEGRKKWEATPDGIKYKEWEASPAGRKVYASHDKIRKHLKDFSEMEAVVTSVTFKRPNAGPRGPKWLIVKINGEEYMMQFIASDFRKLSSLKVDDKIIIRSRGAGYSPNHPYLILSGDQIEKKGEVLLKYDPSKNKGC